MEENHGFSLSRPGVHGRQMGQTPGMLRFCRRSWASSLSVDTLRYKSPCPPKILASIPTSAGPLKSSLGQPSSSPSVTKAKATPRSRSMLGKDQHLGGAAVTGFLRDPTPDDPYRYQCGFGNHHATEAIPGALPRSGTNLPQKARYGLYPEHLNGTSFISSRESVSNV
jgi:hypothetical protein